MNEKRILAEWDVGKPQLPWKWNIGFKSMTVSLALAVSLLLFLKIQGARDSRCLGIL